MAINQPGYITKSNFKGQIRLESLLKGPPAPFHFPYSGKYSKYCSWNHRAKLQIIIVCLWSDRDVIAHRGTWGARGECLCRPEGFISSKHLQDFRFGIVRPIPELHRKRGIKSRRKTPKSISFLASRIMGSIEKLTARCSLSVKRRVYKKWLRWRSASDRATGGSNGLELSATSRDLN